MLFDKNIHTTILSLSKIGIEGGLELVKIKGVRLASPLAVLSVASLLI